MRIVLVVLVVLTTAVSAAAQPPVTTIFTGDGWEAFPGVYYQGGDATHPKKQYGMLVLTDSTIALHQCAVLMTCDEPKKGVPFKSPALYTIQLSSLKQIVSSSRVRSADAMGKLFLGGLASDRPEDFIGLVYETATSVEAPLFKTAKAHSAAIDAKIRFRLKKLGIDLAQSQP